MVSVATPQARAVSRPPASALLEITTAISAGNASAVAAWISAAMFDPRPEIRIATRRFTASPCQIEMAIIDHAMLASGRDHLAEQRHALTGFRENFADRFDGVRFHDSDHADPAGERAQQFEFGDVPLPGQPFEDGQHRQTRKIDADAKVLWQHARNIIGETTGG